MNFLQQYDINLCNQTKELMSLINNKSPICNIVARISVIQMLMESSDLKTVKSILEYQDNDGMSLSLNDLTINRNCLGYCIRNYKHGAAILKYILDKHKIDNFYPCDEIFNICDSFCYIPLNTIEVLVNHLMANFPEKTRKAYRNCPHIPIEIKKLYQLI